MYTAFTKGMPFPNCCFYPVFFRSKYITKNMQSSLVKKRLKLVLRIFIGAIVILLHFRLNFLHTEKASVNGLELIWSKYKAKPVVSSK